MEAAHKEGAGWKAAHRRLQHSLQQQSLQLQSLQQQSLQLQSSSQHGAEAKAKAEEAERQRLAEEALLRGEFMDPEDWILHLSVERTYFQSMDLLEYQQIIKQVPMRTLRMAGIQPVLKYKHLTAEEKKAKAKAEKLEKLKMLQNKNAEGGGGENGGFMSSFGKK